jgi:hypothetical protein
LIFLNQDPVHVSVRSEDAQYDNNGRKVKTLKRRIFAKFQRGIPEWAVPIAEANFDFSYIPPEETVERACGFYDSEADQLRMDWTDEERKAIEAALIERNYLQVAKPLAPLPYPSYAKQRKVQGKRTVEHVISEVQTTLSSTGIDPGTVLAYEADHFDEHSQAIMDIFAAESVEEAEEELVTA